MLWDLGSHTCGQYYRSWSTCVKLTYNVPRNTYTYLVENLLALEFVPIKTELLARYGPFFQSLTKSQAPEVQFLANLISQDLRSSTARNLALVRSESGINSFTVPAQMVRNHVKLAEIPRNQEWRITLLEKLLSQRKQLEADLLDTTSLDDLINPLCSS